MGTSPDSQQFWFKKPGSPLAPPASCAQAVFYPALQANATTQPALSSSPSFPEGSWAHSSQKSPKPQAVQCCHKGGDSVQLRIKSHLKKQIKSHLKRHINPHLATTPCPLEVRNRTGSHFAWREHTSRSQGGGSACVWECCDGREARAQLTHFWQSSYTCSDAGRLLGSQLYLKLGTWAGTQQQQAAPGHCQSQADSFKGCTACKHKMQVARAPVPALQPSRCPTSFPHVAAPRFYTREVAQPSPATQKGQDTHSP